MDEQTQREIAAAISNALGEYSALARSELDYRWENWSKDLSKNELHEVVGALLARQTTLAIEMASSPATWNAHIAPVLLRCMIDCYINLAWILRDPLERSRKFIEYGLGQLKLQLEHRRKQLEQDGHHPEEDPLVQAHENWIKGQKFEFLLEVNIGNWSGIDVRKMAEEAGCLDFYRYSYMPFSAAVHSTWHHVGRLNLDYCGNPLHKYHRVPSVTSAPVDADYMINAAKYLAKAFYLFDSFAGIPPPQESAFEKVQIAFEKIGEKMREAEEPREEAAKD